MEIAHKIGTKQRMEMARKDRWKYRGPEGNEENKV